MPGSSYRLFTTETITAQGSRHVVDGKAATATHYSNKMSPDRYGQLGFTLESTGTLAGTPTLWYSDEDRPDVSSDTDWDQDEDWTPTAIAGSATKEKYVVTGIKARWARIKFVHSGGAGSLYGYATA